MRLIKHPGPPTQPRRLLAAGAAAGEWRVAVPPGAELGPALGEALAARGVVQAALQLVSGGFESLQLRLAVPEGEGGRAVGYGAPVTLEGPLTLIAGSGFLARGFDGRPTVQLHAVVAGTPAQVAGGRLVPARCRVGAEGLVVQIAALGGAGFAEVHDQETGATLLEPLGLPAEGAA